MRLKRFIVITLGLFFFFFLIGCRIERSLDEAALSKIADQYFSHTYTQTLENNQTINDFVKALTDLDLNYAEGSKSYILYGFANSANGSKPAIIIVPTHGLYPVTFHLLPETINGLSQVFSYAGARDYMTTFITSIDTAIILGRPLRIPESKSGWESDVWLWGFEVTHDNKKYHVYFNGSSFAHYIAAESGIIM